MENGSFLSEDSYLGTKSEPLTRNRYAYVSNNPVNYVDPSGYLLEEIEQWASDTWNNLKELGGGLWSAGKDIGNAALNLAKDAYDFGIQELEALRTGKPLKSVESAKKVAADPAKAVIEIQQKVSQSKLGQAVQDYGEVQINHVVVQAGIQAELIEAEKEAMQPVCDWIEENEEAVKIGIGSTVMLGTGIATVFTGVAAPFCIGSVIGGFSGGIIHAIFAEEDKFGAFADGFMWGSIIGAVSPAIGSLITSLGGTYAILKVPAVAMALEGFLETCMEELAIIMQDGDVNLGMFLGDWALNSFTSGSNPQMAKLTEWLEGVFERGRQLLKNLLPEIGIDDVLKKYNLNNTKDVWNLSPTERGKAVEELLAKTEYSDWWNCGAEMGGYYPVVDFSLGNDVVSLKTIDPSLKSYQNGKANDKIIEYIDILASSDIRIDGVSANKILDVRVPEGTKGLLDIDELIRIAEDRGINILIQEF